MILDFAVSIEEQLFNPENRKKITYFLADDFTEVNYSGVSKNKSDVAKEVTNEDLRGHTIETKDYQFIFHYRHHFAITYKSALLSPEGHYVRAAQRISIWVKRNGRWQLRHHQATPMEAF